MSVIESCKNLEYNSDIGSLVTKNILLNFPNICSFLKIVFIFIMIFVRSP